MLTLADLRESTDRLKDVNHTTCKMVLASCNELIKATNATGQTCVVYSIPGVVEGRPMMPPRKVALYVADRLSRGGLHARLLCDSLVYVDWSAPAAKPVKTPATTAKPKPKQTTSTDTESHQLRRKLLNFRRKAAGYLQA